MDTPRPRARVVVLGLTPLLTVTVEATVDGSHPEVHVHAGGQGVWVGRMAHSLGADVVLCAVLGGESGDLVEHLARQEELVVHTVRSPAATGAYVHDRRDGDRTEIVRTDPPPVDRHVLDDAHNAVLVAALDADVVVLTGAEPADVVPAEVLGRLARDLRAAGRRVVADLSGDAARAVVDAGLDLLKMSHSEMVDGGFASGEEVGALVAGAQDVLAGGRVSAVLVSRAADPTLLVTPDGAWELQALEVSTVEHRGAGDSMTAGVAVAVAEGADLLEAARLGVAAGTLNATRHGLGTGPGDLVRRLVAEVRATPLDAPGDG